MSCLGTYQPGSGKVLGDFPRATSQLKQTT